MLTCGKCAGNVMKVVTVSMSVSAALSILVDILVSISVRLIAA